MSRWSLARVFVAVPVAAGKAVVRAAPDLNETDAAFEQSARDEAALTEILRDFLVQAVELFGRRGFAGQIQHFGRAQLHFRREFIRSDAGVQPRIARMGGGCARFNSLSRLWVSRSLAGVTNLADWGGNKS